MKEEKKYDEGLLLFQDMEPENMLVFHENHKELSSAIINAGGNPVFILNGVEQFMRSLAMNKIRIYAEHNPLKLRDI
jgi:hypothetical protein